METRRPHRRQGKADGGATAAASKAEPRQEEWSRGECHRSHRYVEKVQLAMSDEAIK